MKKVRLAIIVIVLIIAFFRDYLGFDFGQVDDTVTNNQTEQTTDLNNLDYLPTTNLGQIMTYDDYFTLSFVNEHRQSEWVAYAVSKADLLKDDFPRPSYFKTDERVAEQYQVSHRDYSRSGFDRGHLAPAADFSWSEEGLETTFYTTNISPQTPDFNRGIWKQLEETARDWTMKYGKLYIVTGPVLTEKSKKKSLKKGVPITVPHRYYKVILSYKNNRPIVVGFLFENEGTNKELSTFALPIDQIEALTGLDFFSKLPDNIEVDIESKVDLSNWPF